MYRGTAKSLLILIAIDSSHPPKATRATNGSIPGRPLSVGTDGRELGLASVMSAS